MIPNKISILRPYIFEDIISEVALGLIADGLEALLQSKPVSIDHIKSSAKLLKIELKKYGVTVNHTQCLQIVSVFFGYKDWHVASAMLKRGAI
jgi:hypothetical protein